MDNKTRVTFFCNEFDDLAGKTNHLHRMTVQTIAQYKSILFTGF